MMLRRFLILTLVTLQFSVQANDFKVGDEVIARKNHLDLYSTIIGIDSRKRFIVKVAGVMENDPSSEKIVHEKIIGGLDPSVLRLLRKNKEGVKYRAGDLLVAYSNINPKDIKPCFVRFLGTRSSYIDLDNRNVFIVERVHSLEEGDEAKRFITVADSRDYTSLSTVGESDDPLYKKNTVVSENESGDIWLLLGQLDNKTFLLSNPLEKKMNIVSKSEVAPVENLTSEIFELEEQDPVLLIPSLRNIQ